MGRNPVKFHETQQIHTKIDKFGQKLGEISQKIGKISQNSDFL